MRDEYEEIKSAGAAELIAISSDTLFGTSGTRRDLNIAFLLLSDEDLETIEAYNVVQLPSKFLARPAAYIIDEDGKIAWKDIGDRFGHRTNSTQIIDALNEL